MKNKPLDNYWFSSMGNLLQLSCADLVLEKNVTKNDKIKIIIPVPLPLTNELLKRKGEWILLESKWLFFFFCVCFYIFISLFLYILRNKNIWQEFVICRDIFWDKSQGHIHYVALMSYPIKTKVIWYSS